MEELKVQTPIGNIIAKQHNQGSDYPGISLQIDDNMPVIYLEYDEVKKKFLITIYTCSEEATDEPVYIIPFIQGKEE